MNSKVFVDTNIILYYLKGDSKIEALLEGYNLATSFMNELELLSAPNISVEQKNIIEILLHNVIEVIPYYDSFKNAAIRVRSQKILKLPDSIIAATAITLKLPFITADKGFRNIDGLEIVLYDPANA